MTTPLPPQPPHDDDALPGDAELKALYDRLPQHEPGPALDAAVLRAAAQAIKSPTVTAHPRTRPRPRWLVAFGTAATLVLAAGVAWQMRKLPTAAPVVPQASVATLKTATDATPAPARQADDTVASRERKAAETRRAASARTSAPAAKRMAAPLADRPATAGSGLTAQPTASGAMSNRMRLPPALTARPPSVEPPLMQKQASSPPPPMAERASPSAPAAMRMAPRPPAPAPAALGPAKPAQQSVPTPEPASTASPSQLTAAPEHMLRSAPAPAAPPPPAPAAPPAPVAPMPQATPAPAPSAPGEAAPATAVMTRELQTIRTLYADGNATTARKLLDAFRQRYPHYKLPADLRAHLDDAP